MAEIKPYETEKTKRQEVEEMFDGIAKHYDLLNHVLSVGIDKSWRRKSVGMLEEATSQQRLQEILDVATGTGDLAICVQRATGSKVTGTDISSEMLKIAESKVKKEGLEGDISLFTADATKLPFSSNRFDAVTVAFGVRNFGDLDAGLAEMQRVLKPGGLVVILEFSRPSNRLFRVVYDFYFKNILPLIGGAISKDKKAYDYLCRSALAFPCGEEFESHLEGVGFKPIRREEMTFGIATAYLAKKR